VNCRHRTNALVVLLNEIDNSSKSTTTMPLYHYERPRAEHSFVGKWHITSMELWDDDYVNMERRAFVEIEPDNHGSFQFGLVRGELDGYLESAEGEPPAGPRDSTQTVSDRFMFTWEGFDELDEASGSGWMRLTSANLAVGLVKFHGGDRSKFQARRVRRRKAGRGSATT
jgi:hypothetical protein